MTEAGEFEILHIPEALEIALSEVISEERRLQLESAQSSRSSRDWFSGSGISATKFGMYFESDSALLNVQESGKERTLASTCMFMALQRPKLVNYGTNVLTIYIRMLTR